MRILYIAKTSLAGVTALMARTVLEHTDHEARACCEDLKHHKWYVRPGGVDVPFCSILETRRVHEWIEWAETVHCMANVSARTLGRVDLLPKKRWVFQWHGAQILPWKWLFRDGDERFYKFFHIGQGWWSHASQTEFFRSKGAILMPNVVAIDDEIHRPLPFRDRIPRRVAFSPSNVRDGVNTKGADATRQALKGFDLDLIVHRPFDDCMRRKAKAYVGIDEVVTPVYHRSGLEFCALGVACVESWSQEAADQLKEMTGADSVPFVPGTIDSLKGIVRTCLLDAALIEKAGQDARAWMERHYHPRDLIQRYVEAYQ